ncbi:MAG TPA: nucleotide sugar dehydrogenase [Planctomycetota bacterium]|nr:nucleotide sugar dehydrogenase [Planctomycetota bacterium]
MGSELAARFSSGKGRVGVIGLGYVGLPLCMEFARKLSVTGFDIDSAKIEKLARGESYIEHISGQGVLELARSGRFQATADFSRLGEVDAIVICVPTPLGKGRDPDMSFIEKTAETISRHLRRGQLISLESTTYPGTTEEVLKPILERSGLKAGRDFLVCFSPEREDPGNPKFRTGNTPKVVGGDGPDAQLAAAALYRCVTPHVVEVSSPAAAEAAKILENTYRAVNIALVNDLKLIFEKMNIDVWEVVEAAATKPFGFQAFYPGPGWGGHCIPIDPFYLSWKARQLGIDARFIELAGDVNVEMVRHVIARCEKALAGAGKGLPGTRVLLLGAAYKKNIDDCRESPALEILEMLLERGAKVDFSDPHVRRLHPGRHHSFTQESVALTPEALAGYDLALLVTDHDDFDYAAILKHSRIVVDTRNAFRRKLGAGAAGLEKVIRA